MKICVVGGTGNISRSFVKLLLDLGHEVTCFNRGQSGKVPDGSRVLHGDRKDRTAFECTMQAERFDAAIDMICYNKEDAQSSLQAFRGVHHFVQCSTACTYGIDFDWLPVTENHPLRPNSDYGVGKVQADNLFLEAYYREGFPVTIIKPSSTYGPKLGVPRQIDGCENAAWIDRIRKGKPIVVCGDGHVAHQFLHVDDAALCFANVLGKEYCIGQTYNLAKQGFTSWVNYHQTAMKVIGREVELIGVPLGDLQAWNVPDLLVCTIMLAHNTIFSAKRLFRDVPEFRPQISLEQGLASVIEIMDREGRIPNSDDIDWEDRIIAAQRRVRENV